MTHRSRLHSDEAVRAALSSIESYSSAASNILAETLNYLRGRIREHEKIGRELEKIVSSQALTIDTLREYEKVSKYLQWWIDERVKAKKYSPGQLMEMTVRVGIPVMETLKTGMHTAITDGTYKP